MRMAVLVGLVLVLGAAAGAEQVEVKPPAAPKPTKAERIEKLNREIFQAERRLQTITPERIAAEEKDNPRRAEMLRADRARDTAALPGLRLERAWLKGEVTRESAEKAVKTAEESAAKAKDPEKASAEAALTAARAELEGIKKLEAAGDF